MHTEGRNGSPHANGSGGVRVALEPGQMAFFFEFCSLPGGRVLLSCRRHCLAMFWKTDAATGSCPGFLSRPGNLSRSTFGKVIRAQNAARCILAQKRLCVLYKANNTFSFLERSSFGRIIGRRVLNRRTILNFWRNTYEIVPRAPPEICNRTTSSSKARCLPGARDEKVAPAPGLSNVRGVAARIEEGRWAVRASNLVCLEPVPDHEPNPSLAGCSRSAEAWGRGAGARA